MRGPCTPHSGRRSPPAQLPGFGHIHRHWDARRQTYVAKIAPGQFYVSRGGEIISTTLGSCVATCIRDTRLGIGGMNHFLLPSSAPAEHSDNGDCITAALRYGNVAMEHLLNTLFTAGARRRDLEVKVFGGGQVMASQGRVGERNASFALGFLQTEGYTLTSSSLGGFSGRKLLYDPASGRALVRRTHSDEQQALIAAEQAYLDVLDRTPLAGEVELF